MFTRKQVWFATHIVLVLLLIAEVLGISPITSAHAATITVTNINNSGAGSLRQAITDAASGDTIAFNLSLGGQIITLETSLIIDKNLIVDASMLNSPITISGVTTHDGTGNNYVFAIKMNRNVALKNLTITKSEINGYTYNGGIEIANNAILTITNCAISNFAGGSGIRNWHGTLIMTDSAVSGNSSDSGGGIANNNGTAVLTNVVISNNSTNSTTGGGGIYNDGDMTITNSTISNNSAIEGGGIRNDLSLTLTDSTVAGNSGGGIYNGNGYYGASMTVANSTISNNSVSVLGGGIESYGPATVTNSTFEENSSDIGGGIYNTSTLTITNSTFSNNHAFNGEGGGVNNSGTLSIVDSTFNDNTARGGGGIYNGGGNVIVDNSAVYDSHASYGGGIYNRYGNMTLNNTTISNNVASVGGPPYSNDGRGGGISNSGDLMLNSVTVVDNSSNYIGGGIYNDGIDPIKIQNSIVADNIADNYSNNCNGAMNSLGHNLIEDECGNFVAVAGDLVGTATNPIVPWLGPLQDNGGPTFTHALMAGSPAINAGDDVNCLATDQRGVTRPQGGQCDIGAFETIVHYVKWDATGANNGSSWTDAYTDLQSALSAASSGDEIWVAAGTYKPTTGTDRTISFTLKNGVAVYGGFVGTETFRSQRNVQTNVTTLGGDIGVAGNTSDNSYHVVVASNTDNTALLDGFTVTGGNAESDNYSLNISKGGGIYNDLGSPTLKNLIVDGNHATFGGGMYNYGDPFYNQGKYYIPIITNVAFSNNSAIEGAGMRNEHYSSPVLIDVSFDSNVASRGGGGMENFDFCDPTLVNVTFNNNAAGAGGGIMNWNGNDPILTNVTFSGNSADWEEGGYSGGEGGGMYNHISSPTLINVTFSDNSARLLGGGLYNVSNSTPDIQNTILWGNLAPSGAQIYDAGSTPVISDSIIQGGYAGGTNTITADPKLGALGNNGGFTQTISLQAGSSAIDTGDDGVCPATDQRGVARPFGSHCDIGAYEYDGEKIKVMIGTNSWTYAVPGGTERREYYPVSGGPVVVESTNDKKIVAAIRLQSFANDTLYSFIETMGVPQGLLSHKYYFPTYNNIWPYLNSQLRFGNLNDTDIDVKVTIGTDSWVYSVPAHTERREYLDVSGGPVVIESLDQSKKIVAAIRLQSYVNNTLYSFAETMGIPDEQLSDTYYFPTYNNTWGPLNSQLRFANLNDTDIKVKVTIGSASWIYPVPAHTERREYLAVSGGPVIIQSLDAVTELPDPSKKIVAAIRLQSFANDTLYSFVETMGVPQGLLSHKYYFPTYNNTWPYLNSQLRFGNLNDTAIDVKVTIGTDSWVYSVPAHTERREYLNVSGGPVVVESLDPNKKIVAAIRLQSMTPSGTLYSFAETMGIPDEQLSDTYYFPTYNNTWAPLNSQLRFGVP